MTGPTSTLDQAIYTPNPVDTKGTDLPSALVPMQEKIAENLHELWAMNRIQAGWTFALVRDESKKQNPCLTAFERLPEQQRQFNMTMAGETLKTFMRI